MQCYRYLLVDCVHKGPVHPLLELPPPKNPISIPLVVDVQAHSVHSLQVSIYNNVYSYVSWEWY